ncbi:MAG: NAD(P)H-dependent oxidoreductase [Marinovum sp.]|nr:NAD(P)H-dependent oxidoreductase [Marinovum sp.]
MANLLVYYVHPGQRFSRVGRAMADVARAVQGITFVDLYAEYPRHDIDVDREQRRLLDHDVILFQFPLYWYSTPSLLKEWQDLVLQNGFAYGKDGDKLTGKTMMLAISTGGSEAAYTPDGYQHHTLRAFLVPLEQTANLCKMHFAPPYALYGALLAEPDHEIADHAKGYGALLNAIRDDRYDFAAAGAQDVVTHDTLAIAEGA